MGKENKILITGILLCLVLFLNIMAVNPAEIKESNLQNTIILQNFSSAYEINETKSHTKNSSWNDTGCCSVIVHVKQGHDIISYRRDSGYPANIFIKKVNFSGQNAIVQYKTNNGYFSHVIITENGWIISIGGHDGPFTTNLLEKLGSNIISRGKIEKRDLKEANLLITKNGGGHFLIKSPDNYIGTTIYDSQLSTSRTELFKMNDGDYVKVPNTPIYYNNGRSSKYSTDPLDAAIQIVGKDPYGVNRRDVTTYELTSDNNSTKVNISASFDGGTLTGRNNGNPDNILFIDGNSSIFNKIKANEIPRIPNKMFLREETLREPSLQSNDSLKEYVIIPILIFMFIGAVFYRKYSE